MEENVEVSALLEEESSYENSDDECDTDSTADAESSDESEIDFQGEDESFEITFGRLVFAPEAKKVSDPYNHSAWARLALKDSNIGRPNVNSTFPWIFTTSGEAIQKNRKKIRYYCTGCKSTKELATGDKLECKNKEFHQLYRESDFKKLQKYQSEGVQLPCYSYGNIPDGNVVITCDGSYKNDSELSVNAVFIRDHKLQFMESSGTAEYKERYFNSNDSETEALDLALKNARKIQEVQEFNKDGRKVLILSDSKLAVDGFNIGKLNNPKHKGKVRLELINQCRVTAGLKEWKKYRNKGDEPEPKEETDFLVQHIPREMNQLAHLAAIRHREGEFEIRELTESMQRVLYEEKDLGICRVKVPKKILKTMDEFEAERKSKRSEITIMENSRRVVPLESDKDFTLYQKVPNAKKEIENRKKQMFSERVKRTAKVRSKEKMGLAEFQRRQIF